LVILGMISFTFFIGKSEILWPQQKITYVYVISVLELFDFLGMCFIQLGESKAETLLVKKITFCGYGLKIILLLFLYYISMLSLNSFIIVNYISSLCIILPIIFYLIYRKYVLYFKEVINKDKIKANVRYYLQYCKPFIVLSIVTFGYEFFDRWFLQITVGSKQQAYYSLAFNISAISMLFTTSIINIYWREVSQAMGNNDFERIKRIFVKVIKFNYFITSCIACFMAINSRELVTNLAGSKFNEAWLTFLVISFYPVHQSIGQLTGAFFLATERTKLYKNIAILTMALSMPITYLFLAPKSFLIPGLQAGALGLAVKMVSINIITTNILLYYSCKKLEISCLKMFCFQPVPLIINFICGAAIFAIIRCFEFQPFVINIFLEGIGYLFLVMLCVIMCPNIVGLSKDEIRFSMRKVFKLVK
jgi:O-antigen/teichoic acid export membrane protein